MTTTVTEEKRKYELMVIFTGEVMEKEFEKDVAEVKKYLSEANASIFHEENWGKRDLSYRIKRQSRGYYMIFDFEAAPSVILELRSNIKLYPNVLRSMIVSLPAEYDPEGYKKVVLKPRSEEVDENNISSAGVVRGGKGRMVSARPEATAPAPRKAVGVAGKEDDEKLKKVEKKLEQILENPDIDVR